MAVELFGHEDVLDQVSQNPGVHADDVDSVADAVVAKARESEFSPSFLGSYWSEIDRFVDEVLADRGER